MSLKLALIARRMNLQTPERIPAPADDDLTAAIQRLIDQRVSEALEEQRPVKQPAHVRRLMDDFNRPEPTTDFRQIPPTPRTQPLKAMEFQFQRDELGRVAVVNAGNMQFRVQRNELGQIVRMVPSDMVSEVRYDGQPVPPPNK